MLLVIQKMVYINYTKMIKERVGEREGWREREREREKWREELT